MKLSRSLLITAGAVCALGVVCIAIAFTPAVQRWAVLKATSSTPGLKLELGRVSAGLSSAELRDVRVEQDGVVVTAAKIDANYSLTKFIFGNRLKVDHLAADGLVIDASKMNSAAKAAGASAPATAPGVLGQVSLPFELELGELRLAGRAQLPAAPGETPLSADFKISGGKFSPGQEGQLVLTGTVKNPATDATVSALNASVNLRATQNAQLGFSQISVVAVLDAEGKGLPGQTQLKVAAHLSQETKGENYQVNVDTLIAGAAENVLTLKATLPSGQKQFSGQWTVKARTAQLAPFFLGGILPEFATSGEGRFVFSPEPLALSLQGELASSVSRLELMDPAWRAFGALESMVSFDLEGSAQQAKLNHLKVSVAGAKPVLDLETLNRVEFDFATSRLQVGGATTSKVLDLQLHGVPMAWVRPFVTEADISGGMIVGRFSVISENGRLLVRSPEPLKIDGLSVVKQGVLLLAKADLSLRPEAELAPAQLNASVKEFSLRTAAGDVVTAETAVSLPVPFKAPIAMTANYRADLPALVAAWLPVGRVKSAGEVDLTLQSGGHVELRRFATELTDGAGELFFKAASVRGFSVNLKTGLPTTGETKAVDLVKVTFGTIPLAKIPLSQAGVQLTGAMNLGDFILAAAGEKMTLSAMAPVKLTDVVVLKDGKTLLSGLGIQARPVAEISGPTTGALKSGEVVVKNAKGAVLLTLSGEASKSDTDGLRAAMTFNVDVPTLGSQPVFAGAQAMNQGKASGEIRAASGAQHVVEARLTVNGLVARDFPQALPVANLSLRAMLDAKGNLSLQAPLLLDRAGQRSDLNFLFELQPKNETYQLAGKISGEHVELSDLLAVAAVFQPAPSASSSSSEPKAPVSAGSTPARSVVADTKPLWSLVNGQVALDIKSVTQGASWTMSGLSGLVVADAERLSLQKFDATFDATSKLEAKGALTFVPGSTPYKLTGDFSLKDFDAGKFLKALEPSEPPTLEGVVTVTGKANSDGRTIQELLDRTRGQFHVTSRQGVFRGLKRVTDRISMTSKAVEAIGSLFGSKTAEKIGGNAVIVDQIAQLLGEIPYDQLSIDLSRDESLNYKLQEFALMALDVRLAGSGQISYVEGKGLLQQPMNASLSIGARGKVAEAFNKIGILDTAKDDFGYLKSKEALTLGGTAAKPNATAFFTRLLTLKAGDFLAR